MNDPYTRIDTVTFFNYFNTDEFFRDFYKSRKYHPESISEIDQIDPEPDQQSIHSDALFSPEYFLRFIIDGAFIHKHNFFFELERLVTSLNKTEDERLSFCNKFLVVLDVLNFRNIFGADRIGPYTKEYFDDDLDFIDIKYLLADLPLFIEKWKSIGGEQQTENSSFKQSESKLFNWVGPPSKFIELLHMLRSKHWIEMPLSKAEGVNASYAKVAKLILKHIDFSHQPKESAVETWLKSEFPKEADPFTKFTNLFKSNGGPYFDKIGPKDGTDPASLN